MDVGVALDHKFLLLLCVHRQSLRLQDGLGIHVDLNLIESCEDVWIYCGNVDSNRSAFFLERPIYFGQSSLARKQRFKLRLVGSLFTLKCCSHHVA